MTHSPHKKLFQHAIILLILVITVGNVAVFTEYQNLFRLNDDILTSGQTLKAANQAILSLYEAGMKVSSFLISDDNEAMKTLPQTVISAELNLAMLKTLIQDTPEQVAAYNQLKPLFDDKTAFLNNVIKFYQAGDKRGTQALAADKNRFAKTNIINGSIIDIKKIENTQLSINRALFHSHFVIANALFIAINLVSLALLLFCFIKLHPTDKNTDRI